MSMIQFYARCNAMTFTMLLKMSLTLFCAVTASSCLPGNVDHQDAQETRSVSKNDNSPIYLPSETSPVTKTKTAQHPENERNICFIKIRQAYAKQPFIGIFNIEDKSCEKYKAEYDQLIRIPAEKEMEKHQQRKSDKK